MKFINPTFLYGGNEYKFTSIKIIDSTFRNNNAFDGYSIYIEGEDKGTTFEINNNIFIGSYDLSIHSSSKSVITSEIYGISNGKNVENNKFNDYKLFIQEFPIYIQ